MIQRQQEALRMKNNIKVIARALKISIQNKGIFSLIISLLGFAAAFLPVLVSRSLASLTDALQTLTGSPDSATLRTSLGIFGLVVSLFITQTVFNSIRDYTRETDRIKISQYIKKTVMRHKCNVRYKYIENYDRFSERTEFADSYAGYQVAGSMNNIIGIAQRIITFISVSIALWDVNPYIILVILVTSVPALILAWQQKDENFRWRTKCTEEGLLVIHYFFLCADKAAIQEVRHYGLFDYLKARWRAIADDYCGKKNKMIKKHVKYNTAADLLRSVVYIAVLLIAANEIYRNPALGLGLFTLTYTLSGQMQEVTAALFTGIIQFVNDVPYMKEFFSLDKLEREPNDAAAVAVQDGSIRFENVSFAYPNTDALVLDNINVSIRDGEKIAIVGDNGSGKSTFISLLCGIFDPGSGNIYIGGKPLKGNIPSARKAISVVFQKFGKYEITLRENITVSDKSRRATDDEILGVASSVNALDVISEQELGLSTTIGVYSKNSNTLSEGQWQKVSLIRAAYRSDAKIMILDEPTASLDPLAEARLYRDFSKITGKRTTVLISHRLGITSVVDRILVFRNGRIVEDGSHEELMSANGVYAEMYRAQAQWYK